MRTKIFVGIFAILFAVTLTANFSFAQKDANPAEETITCPVSGEKALKSEAAGPYKYEGKEYYFCCNNCLEKFKTDPEKYATHAHDVVCGMNVDKETAKKVTHEGEDYYFCSDHCVKAFKKDPAGQIEKFNKAAKEKCEKEHGDKKAAADKKDGCCSGEKTK